MKEFKAFKAIGRDSSTKSKETILKLNDTPTMRKLLLCTYSPFITFRLQQIDLPDKYNTLSPDVSDELFQVLDLLASHTIGSKESKAVVKRLLAKVTEEDAEWICKIIRKDLKIGISDSTINKSFPDLIPTFKVMLANPIMEYSKGIEHWSDVKYPCEGTEKIDGLRCVVICDGVSAKFFSRAGLEFLTLDHLIPQVLKLSQGSKVVFDCEVAGIKYNPNCKVAKKNYEANRNWVFAQGSSMVKSSVGTYSEKEMTECVGLMIFDMVEYEYFVSQGKEGSCEPLRKRKTRLAGLFESLPTKLPSIQMLPNRILETKDDALEFFKEVMEKDGEGIIMADLDGLYEFRRCNGRLKLKEHYTADLRVIDCEEGTKGTRNEGSLGAIVVSDGEGITGKLMGGWTDDEGLLMWLRYKRGEFVDSIVECAYMEITANNCLRHGVFIRERDDKSEISWG